MKRLLCSFYYRIFAMALLLILLLSLSIGAILWNTFEDLISRQLEKYGTEIARHVAMAGGNYILTEDLYNLYELAAQTAASSEDVRYILIFDSKGQLLAHTFPTGIPRNLIAQTEDNFQQEQSRLLRSNEGMIHDILSPIENGAVGYVRVGMTEVHMRNTVGARIRSIGLAIFLICLIAALLSNGISTLIAKPLRRLTLAADALGRGDLDTRVAASSDPETNKLAAAFNQMAEGLTKSTQEREKLLKELRLKEQMRGRLIKKLLTAQEDDRKRISRELHDETSQALTSLMLTMRVLSEEAPTEEQRQALILARDAAADILQDVRSLAVELRPPQLDDLGLMAAIEQYTEQFASRHGLRVSLETQGTNQHPPDHIAVALYRILQESLSNVVQHSGADEVKIRMDFQPDQIRAEIADNGCGISSADLTIAKQKRRLGLYGMRERIELLKGKMEISRGKNGGARLELWVPIEPAEKKLKGGMLHAPDARG